MTGVQTCALPIYRGDGSRGELIDKVIAEGHLGGGCAAELALPRGDVAIFEVGVVKLAEGAFCNGRGYLTFALNLSETSTSDVYHHFIFRSQKYFFHRLLALL